MGDWNEFMLVMIKLRLLEIIIGICLSLALVIIGFRRFRSDLSDLSDGSDRSDNKTKEER